MNHNIMITVDGYSWAAYATTHHTGTQREVTAVSCADVPLQVLGVLADHIIDVHDVLELVRNYLNDTGAVIRSATCGPVSIEWRPLDAAALREDLTGNTYAVKLTDQTGKTHEYEVGACSSWSAMDQCKEQLRLPVWSSVVVPLGY